MLGVQHQVRGEQPRRILRGLFALEHPQEVGGVRQLRVGRDRGAAIPDLLMRGDNHRHLGAQSYALAQGRLAAVVRRFRIECCKRRNSGAQNIHRMGILHGGNDVQHSRWELTGRLEVLIELGKLAPSRQLTIEQQVRSLLERRMLSEVMDGIAAVTQLTCLAVDECRGGTLEVDVLQTTVDSGLVLCRVHMLEPPFRNCDASEDAGVCQLPAKEFSRGPTWTSSPIAWPRSEAAG